MNAELIFFVDLLRMKFLRYFKEIVLTFFLLIWTTKLVRVLHTFSFFYKRKITQNEKTERFQIILADEKMIINIFYASSGTETGSNPHTAIETC